MGVDTRLLISSRWSLEDVKDVLEYHQGIKSKFRSCCKISTNYIIIDCENGRSINCFMNSNTAIGSAIQLSLRSNPEAIKMVEGIASILGGFVNKEDFTEIYEEFPGYFYEEDGLPYHYKYAATHNEISNNDDFADLKQSVDNWNAKYRKAIRH